MHEYNLIIDLDNTMICSKKIYRYISNFNEVTKMITHKNFIYYHNYNDSTYLIFARPKLKEFLQDAYKNFNLYVFTLANNSYAEPIIKKLEQIYQIKFLKFWTKNDLDIDIRTNKKFKCMCVTKLDINKTFIIDDNMDVWINHIGQDIKIIKINQYMGPYDINYIKDDKKELIQIKEIDVNQTDMEDMLIYLDYLKKLINTEYTVI